MLLIKLLKEQTMTNEQKPLTNKEAKALVKKLAIRKYTDNPLALSEYADQVYFQMLKRLEENLDCLDLETTAAIMTQIGNFSNKRRELIVKYMGEANLKRILDQREKENPFSDPVKLVSDSDKNV